MASSSADAPAVQSPPGDTPLGGIPGELVAAAAPPTPPPLDCEAVLNAVVRAKIPATSHT
jgi:hypothetical protein